MKEKMKRIISLLFLVCCCSVLFVVPAMADGLSDDFSVEQIRIRIMQRIQLIVFLEATT